MKYYAVSAGRNLGIYKSWNECEKQVKGFPKAVFKSFTTLKEAEDFLKIDSKDEKEEYTRKVIFTDGSYKNNKSCSGVWIPDENKGLSSLVPGDKQTNNVAELFAILIALRHVKDKCIPLLIYSDSFYAVNSLSGKFKISEYIELFNLIFKEIENRNVKFEHVYGHERDDNPIKLEGNSNADYYAGLLN